MDIQALEHHLLKRLVFFSPLKLWFWQPSSKLGRHSCQGLFLGSLLVSIGRLGVYVCAHVHV